MLVAGGLAYRAAPLFALGLLIAVHLVTVGSLSLLMLSALLPFGGAAVLAGFLCAIANFIATLRGVQPLPLPARFVVAALMLSAKRGDADGACRLAADAHALLRISRPQEATSSILPFIVSFACSRALCAPTWRTLTSEIATVDVRELRLARRHALIFDTYSALPPDGAFVLISDHDPKPFDYQFRAERLGEVRWEYLKQGPQVWRVRIGRKTRVAG